jgi:hypothetical protein
MKLAKLQFELDLNKSKSDYEEKLIKNNENNVFRYNKMLYS